MYYRIQQIFTAFTKTVISIWGANDSLLSLQIFVSQNMNGWILGLFGKNQPFIFIFLLFSRSVVSHSLRPHGLQHTSLPCPSPSPGACSNSCPLSQWCHPTISSSIVPFSSCLQSFPASGSFPMSQLFTSSDQSIGASSSVLPMSNIQDLFILGLIGLISL